MKIVGNLHFDLLETVAEGITSLCSDILTKTGMQPQIQCGPRQVILQDQESDQFDTKAIEQL